MTVVWDGTPDRPMGKYLAMEQDIVREPPPPPVIQVGARERVYAALEANSMTATELIASLGIRYRSLHNHLFELRKSGRTTIVGRQPVIPPRYGHRSVAIYGVVKA
jgi:DNA-binding transcriptional ArsR family regulator